MKNIALNIEQSEELFSFPSARNVLIIFLGVLIVLGTYLVSAIYEWEYYYFLIFFCITIFIVALIRFDIIFLFVPITLTNPYALFQGDVNIQLSEIILPILYLVWVIKMAISGEKLIFPRRFLVPSLAIIATAFLSLLVARYYMPGLLHIVRYIEIFVVFFMVVLHNCQSEYQIKRIFLFLIIGGLVASLVGVGQFFFDIMTTGEVHRVFGWHGGTYGAVIASILILSVSALLYQRNKILKVWATITIPFAGLALILSQTRAWIGALFLAFGIMFYLAKQNVIKRVMMIVGIVISVILLALVISRLGIIDSKYFITALEGAFRFGSSPGKRSVEDIALLMRFNVWLESIRLYITHPFIGIGVGNLRFVGYFPAKLGMPASGVAWVDNQYIQFFTEAGTIAGIAWILYVSRAVRLGMQSVQQAIGSDLYAPAIGFFLSLLILVIGSFFWIITNQHELFALMVLYIGLLFNMYKLKNRSTDAV